MSDSGPRSSGHVAVSFITYLKWSLSM